MTTFVPSTDALVVRVQSCFEEIAEGSAVFARMTTAALPNGTPAGVPMPQMPTPQQFAAAMPQMPAPQLLEPNTVATQFVQQYYHVLSNWPGNLHRFYTERHGFTSYELGMGDKLWRYEKALLPGEEARAGPARIMGRAGYHKNPEHPSNFPGASTFV